MEAVCRASGRCVRAARAALTQRDLGRLLLCVIAAAVPAFASAQFRPDLHTTPFRIVNKLRGFCIQQYEDGYKGTDALLFRTATCSDTDFFQKFYFFDHAADTPYVPQLEGRSEPVRILEAGSIEFTPRQWYNLNADASPGSFVYNLHTDIQFPALGGEGGNAYWYLTRKLDTQNLVNTQFEGLIFNASTHNCLSYQDHNPAMGTQIVSGTCQNEDVWRLEPTTYFTPSSQQ
ncbi:hypothetical protein E5CHR_03658 [Variovorax sp. PBL-E5]|nr:hypothetical protein E5CHR_03658 [Variovorax sp. PBL-E5]